ncbi:hypothetical protein ACFQU7_07000 [Pseudoroseomonas wenyumeiae]
MVPLREALRHSGVTLHENSAVATVEHAGAGVALVLEGGARLEGSHLVLALGQAPRLSPSTSPPPGSRQRPLACGCGRTCAAPATAGSGP